MCNTSVSHDKGHRLVLEYLSSQFLLARGDKLVELSPKCTRYNSWAKRVHVESKGGTTLLEPLDPSFGMLSAFEEKHSVNRVAD